MRALIIVLLVVSILGVTPVLADMETVPDQTAVKELDIVEAPLELSKQDKNDAFQTNIEVLNGTKWDLKTHNTKKLALSEPIVKINTTGVVMQSTSYNCGPAALATVLNNLGINATEQELAILAGTDESGTTMYGLVQSARVKGVNAIGIKLSQDNLKKNDIVFLNISGNTHYSVVKEVTNESVKLADPSLGNIEIPKKQFEKVYSGYSLIISDTAGNLNVYNLEERNSKFSIMNKC